MPAPAVRVFISSTFRDMHAERDHLVTVVFPELRERVERLGFEFYDVDLRWGVPQTDFDGERANSWAYCKKWIDRVEPFFVAILGQRYGWVPKPSDLGDAGERARFRRRSITEMEIRYAVLNRKLSRRSFFYFRRSEVAEGIEPGLFREFVDPDDQKRLEALKREIERGGRPVRHYDCRWTGRGFEDLDAFGRLVLEDLWSGVLRDRRYVPRKVWREIRGRDPAGDPALTDEAAPIPPDVADRVVDRVRPSPRDPWEAERENMAAFARSRVRWYRGGRKALRQLRRFAAGKEPVQDGGLCVVTGPPGSGKSSLLARFAAGMTRPRHVVITHFVGATERSADVRGLLARLLHELDRSGLTGPPESDGREDVESLKSLFHRRLSDYAGERRVILVIDALNQLTEGHDLDWLPRRVGAGVRIIVSTLEEAGTDRAAGAVIRSLDARRPAPERVPVGPLSESETRGIVVDYLEEYSKELDREQLDTICRMEESRNPLYLLVMLAILRTLGGNDMNEAVPRLISEMRQARPDAVSLFDWMLERFEMGFGREVVRSWFAYLALGRRGFSSRELADLIDRRLGPEAARAALLVERAGRQYLLRRGPQMDFFHGQLREAVLRRYVPADPRRLHAEVSRYLETRWRVEDPHAFAELCHHQTAGRLWGKLASTLCDLDFLQGKCEAGMAHDLVADFDAALDPEGLPGHRRGRVEEFARFVRAESHLLSLRPGLLFQQALNQPEGSAPASVARERAAGRAAPRAWLSWLNKPDSLDGCVMTLEGHAGYVNTCGVSPDGKWIVSCSADKTLKLWDARRGKSVRTYEGHPASVESCAFSPTGDSLVSADTEGHLMVWDVGSGILRAQMRHGDQPVATCAWSPTADVVASAGYDHTLRLWDPSKGEQIAILKGAGAYVLSCAFSPDGSWLVSGDAKGRMKLWDVRRGEELEGPPFGHEKGVWGCAVSPDGRWIVSSSEDGTLRRWSARTRRQGAVFEGHEAEVWCCAVSPDGSQVLSGSEDATVRVWSMATGRDRAVLRGHEGAVWGCVFTPAGDQAVSASWDGSLKFWDPHNVAMAEPPRRAKARGKAPSERVRQERDEALARGASRGARHRGAVLACDVSADGRLFLSGAGDGSVTVWDARTGAPLLVLEGHEDYVSAVTISPDGRWIVSGDLQGELRVYDRGARRRGPPLPPHDGQVGACAFSADGSLLATCSLDGTLRLWDVGESGFKLRVARSWPDGVESCAFCPDGLIVAGGGGVRVLDPGTTTELRPFPRHPGVLWCAVTRDGRLLATASSDGSLKLWDVASRRELVTLSGHTEPVQSCAFSPDGTRLVSASWDRTLKVWDTALRSGSEVLAGHTGQLQDVRFSADGRMVLSAAMDGTLRLWDADTGAELGFLVGPLAAVRACTPSRDGRWVASADHDRSIKLWDGSTGREVRTLSGHAGQVRSCAFSPDGTLLASASADATVRIWEVESGRLLTTLKGHRGPVSSCAFAPDGSVIASGSWDSTIRLWRGGGRRRLLGELPHPGWVEFLAYTPDGRRLISASRRDVGVWDAAGRLVEWLEHPPSAIMALELSPDGTYLAWGCWDGSLIVRQLGADARVATPGHQGAVFCVAFSGDGKLVVTGGSDGLLKLWDPRSGKELRSFHRHEGRVRACALSSDGRFLASGAEDGFVRAWDAVSGALLSEFWSRAAVTSVRWRPGSPVLAVGDAAGRLHMLSVDGRHPAVDATRPALREDVPEPAD